MISLINLKAMCRVQLNRIIEEIENHAADWSKNQKCSCIHKKNKLVECEHLIADRNKKFKKKINQIHKKLGCLSSITLWNLNK